MAELLVARDYLQAEGECVRRINTNYAYLAHTASASVKVIAESIGRWRTCEQGTIVGPVMPPALSPSEGESGLDELVKQLLNLTTERIIGCHAVATLNLHIDLNAE